MPERSLEYMNHIIRICRDYGADLLLLGTPSPENYSYKRHNTLQAYADEHGLTFVDLNLQLEDIGIDWNKDSLDNGDHLSYRITEEIPLSRHGQMRAGYMKRKLTRFLPRSEGVVKQNIK